MDDTYHPWADSCNRYPRDARLRKFNFKIKRRPRKGPAIWERWEHGEWVSYTEMEALQKISIEVKLLESTHGK